MTQNGFDKYHEEKIKKNIDFYISKKKIELLKIATSFLGSTLFIYFEKQFLNFFSKPYFCIWFSINVHFLFLRAKIWQNSRANALNTKGYCFYKSVILITIA